MSNLPLQQDPNHLLTAVHCCKSDRERERERDGYDLRIRSCIRGEEGCLTCSV